MQSISISLHAKIYKNDDINFYVATFIFIAVSIKSYGQFLVGMNKSLGLNGVIFVYLIKLRFTLVVNVI